MRQDFLLFRIPSFVVATINFVVVLITRDIWTAGLLKLIKRVTKYTHTWALIKFICLISKCASRNVSQQISRRPVMITRRELISFTSFLGCELNVLDKERIFNGEHKPCVFATFCNAPLARIIEEKEKKDNFDIYDHL